ncbi:tRNA (adenosine(37)-N6)-threonylcarbamoyltransferase complex ATPase subunit type 1 TsaE [Salibacteraceae bacterium]|nr:tRNA (adenosine(37)-N6)-threonylcarbamoyltransferase complex ATPase subunit type 1 TsaE [Salibacteraceae bacterium]
MTLTVSNPEDPRVLVEAIIPLIGKYQVFCFKGELGAGKTTYIKALCQALGVKSATSSPSFSIVNEYERDNNGTIFHFDLYRLSKPDELLEIGWFDYLNSEHPLFIEWPEMAQNLIPSDAVTVEISQNSDDSRSITLNLPS